MTETAAVSQTDAVAAVRRFSRFYTRQLGLLGDALLDSDFSLTEARVLYELAHRDAPTATDLCRDLGLDAGYLSRILKAFDRRGLITRTASPRDGRQMLLTLTQAGRAAFEPLDRASQEEILAMLGRLGPQQRRSLVRALHTAEALLGTGGRSTPPAGHSLRARIRLGRNLRSACRRNPGWLRQASRSTIGTKLDRRTRWRNDRFGVRDARVGFGRQAAVTVCGTHRPRAWSGPQSG
jgi:DNA-binding MarR family transcriptional regulator